MNTADSRGSRETETERNRVRKIGGDRNKQRERQRLRKIEGDREETQRETEESGRQGHKETKGPFVTLYSRIPPSGLSCQAQAAHLLGL